MIRIDFNQGWLFSKAGDTLQTAVTLPHDAMIHENRSPDSPGGSANAYFPGGRYIYEKTFTTLAEWQDKTLILEFEGVYRNSSIYLNDRKIGGRNYGYIPFHVDLTDHLNPGATNTLRVEVDNSQLPNSRWYSGSGIYRPVSLLIGGRTHIQPEGVRITTLSLEPAVIRVETEVTGGEVIAEIYDGQYKVASGQGNAVVLKIENASLWSAENPHCYTCRVMVSEQGDVVDEATVSFGIRTISWSPAGLQINGKETKLRGACVHHDNGLLGAVSYPASEERRVRILRQAGYNALRISHNPASRSLLEACDRLGLYVIDETWDMWYIHKNKHDYATDFMAGYQDDIRSLVARDYNHPSVIMYSIGNEVTEPYEARGVELTRSMVDLFHQLDSTRAVTGGINLMII
ncbi:MAG TPA: glycoside hydrolase family 2, partial [Clostridiales bacterium]|nr:glycoside hydrolase family 2 [Clostridiales bacterium]